MNINKFKRFKLISILIWFVLNITTTIVSIIGIVKISYYFYYLLILEAVFLIFLIFSFSISYIQFNFDGNEILCYAGWEKHLLIINGELVDEHNTSFSFTPIELTYKDDRHHYYMRVSLSNSITVKIDGKLIK